MKQIKISNGYCYSIVINACSHFGEIKKAEQIFNMILKKDKNNKMKILDKIIIKSLIDCFLRNKDFHKASSIYNQFKNILN